MHDLFQDNENSRAIALEEEFNSTFLQNFSSVLAYCQQKTLVDKLKDVRSPILNQCPVLRMVAWLTPAYKGVALVIRHKKVLPPFYKARSMLALEEAGLKQITLNGDTAMVVIAHELDNHHNSRTSQPRGSLRNNLRNLNKPSGGDTNGPSDSNNGGHRSGCIDHGGTPVYPTSLQPQLPLRWSYPTWFTPSSWAHLAHIPLNHGQTKWAG